MLCVVDATATASSTTASSKDDEEEEGDVSHLNKSDSTAVCLVLTPTALVVASAEEDALEAAHPLAEVALEACRDDPTKMTLSLVAAAATSSAPAASAAIPGLGAADLPQMGVGMGPVAKDRVKQFVMETAAGGHCTVSDIGTEEQEGGEEEQGEEEGDSQV